MPLVGVPLDLTTHSLIRSNGPFGDRPLKILKPILSTSEAVDHVRSIFPSISVALKDVSVTRVASSTAAENSENVYTSPQTKLLFTSSVTVLSLNAPVSMCSHLGPFSPP